MDLYPARTSENFSSIISSKAEFRELMDIGTLYPHQELVRRYMSPYTPYDSILLYHSMGTGKTFTCIAIAEDHYRHAGRRCIVLTKGLTSRNSYISQIISWLRRRDPEISARKIKQYMSERYIFSHHTSFCKYRLGSNNIDTKLLDNIILVVDEVHNINPSTSTVSNPVYDNLKRYIHRLSNSKILLLSGTPLVNDTRKILSILPLILPKNIVVDDDTLHNIYALSNIARGYVSYYECDNPSVNVRYIGREIQDTKYKVCISYMSGVQKDTCEILAQQGMSDAIYSNSVSASLFVFDGGIYGQGIDDKILVPKVLRAGEFVSAFMSERRIKYRYTKFTVASAYKHQIEMDNLAQHSCKYYSIIKEIITRSRECCFVFIREVIGSGLLLFSAILESLGYELYYGQDLDTIPQKRRYTVCVGDRDISPNNKDRIEGFNNSRNRYGDYVQVLVGSAVVGESISLLNVRHFHNVSPHWNDAVIEQAMRRVIRTGSHDALPFNERYVDIFLHAAYIAPDVMSVDHRKILISQGKETYLDPLRNNLRTISIEHILSKNTISRLHLDCSSYINYITEEMLDKYNDIIIPTVHKPTNIFTISMLTYLPMDIIKYSLLRCIADNIQVRDYYGRIGYIRESCGIISITKNRKSCPVDMEVPKIIYRDIVPYVLDNFNPLEFIGLHDLLHPVDVIRTMTRLSWSQRILVLETSITISSNIRNIFSIYIVNNSHVYNYRRPNKGSYKSLLVGIRPKGLARCLADNGHWYYMAIDDEKNILESYEDNLRHMRSVRSIDGHIYTMSTTDLIIRVVILNSDHKDRREYNRGRSLDTLPRDVIDKCHMSILGYIASVQDLIDALINRDLIVYV